MKLTVSKLRENIDTILDNVIATGEPVGVLCKGAMLRIAPEKRIPKLVNLKKRAGFVGNPDNIIALDWSKAWTELK